ncbi:DUF3857 and transglutaminase domain-containing protein [Teredinibacter haidensis]|uniref:DUF3857 and transglutaminase domain-containing protein n=1 Tax=Teredinibacter haidensis TaxID=2731755 RepID=UPI0009FA9C28|nr:DUF3857 and transglutaminase domain-containing protein [Teredinibacter haidensis]
MKKTLSLTATFFGLFFFFALAVFNSVVASPLSDSPSASIGPELSKQAKMRSSTDGAEVLHSIAEANLDEKGFWSRRDYISIRINDQEAARDYGRIAITYNHYYSEALLEFANVVTPNGKVTAVAEDAVQLRVTGGGQDFYNDRSEIVFSLPNIAPGSTIEFQYVNTTKRRAITTVSSDVAGPHWFQRRVGHDGWRADAVRNFQYTLSSPRGLKFLTKTNGSFKKEPKVSAQGDRRVSRWRWKDIPSTPLESHLLPMHNILPSVRVSTSRDWSQVDAWTWEKVADKLNKTPALEKVIKQLKLPDNASRETKIRAVYQFMQHNIRYVFAHLGRGGYEPHYPDEALKNGYGDCKDQTVLTIALLRILGVEALPVLVETPGSGKSDTTLVHLIFDHMLVWIPPEGEEPALWLDTTADRALYPGMSNYLADQPALIVNGNGGIFKAVDAEMPANIATLNLDYRETNGLTVVNAVYSGSGSFEQSLRQWWKHDTNRDTSVAQFLGGIFENKGQYTVTSEVRNAENLFEPTALHAEFVFKSPQEIPTYGTSFGQLYNLVGEAKSMQIPESRKNIWYDPYPLEYRLKSLLHGDTGVVPALISSSDLTKTPYFELMQSGKVEGNNYVVEISFIKPPLKLSVDEYQRYFTALLKLGELQNWVVSMQKDPKKQRLAVTDNLKQKHGLESVEYQLALARKYLDAGEFPEALIPAEEAVRLNPNSAEAWFVLGTAQGFNTLIDQANASFKKAKSLGYLP